MFYNIFRTRSPICQKTTFTIGFTTHEKSTRFARSGPFYEKNWNQERSDVWFLHVHWLQPIRITRIVMAIRVWPPSSKKKKNWLRISRKKRQNSSYLNCFRKKGKKKRLLLYFHSVPCVQRQEAEGDFWRWNKIKNAVAINPWIG